MLSYYNREHHHSGIGLHTPDSVHDGTGRRIRERRQQGLDAAYAASCTVERLMQELDLAGARRGKRVRTTIRGDAAARPADLVRRAVQPSALLRWIEWSVRALVR